MTRKGKIARLPNWSSPKSKVQVPMKLQIPNEPQMDADSRGTANAETRRTQSFAEIERKNSSFASLCVLCASAFFPKPMGSRAEFVEGVADVKGKSE
jgi:hypothetical protein